MQRLLASYFGGDHWVIAEHLDSEKALEAFNSENHDGSIKLTSNFRVESIFKHATKLYSMFDSKTQNIDKIKAIYIGDDDKVKSMSINREWFIQTAARYKFYTMKVGTNLNYLHVAFYNISTEELALLLTSEEEHVRKVANRLMKFF
jgi:primase-polymerase (primpol)-like protein